MATLQLLNVPPRQGLAWVRDGFVLFFRRPLAFSALFAVFLVAMLVVMSLPLVGSLIVLAALPLLTLGFMLASHAAQQGAAVQPGQYIEGLRHNPQARRALLQLCALYALCSVLILLTSDVVDGGRFEKLQTLLASGKASRDEVDALLAEPQLAWGMVLRFGLASLLSVPFWHAPALVHWGGQGMAQALFSSTLAVWRARGAFVLYVVAWAAVIGLFGLVSALLFGALGMGQAVGVAAVPAGLMFSTVFYVSLYFTFRDSFGEPGV